MSKPSHIPTWDTNLTNAVEPVSGRKTDGYATNDIPTSANLNWLFAYIYLWLKWVDDGIWVCASLVVSGYLQCATFYVTATAEFVGAVTFDAAVTFNSTGDFESDLNTDGNLTAGGNVTATGTANSIPLQALQSPSYQNSWVDAFSGGGGEDDGKYWKNPFGEVELKGVIAGGATTSIAFTLPSGYRPPFQMRFPVLTATGATESEKVGAVTVNTNGTVAISYPSGTGTVYLNGIRFRV